MRNITDPEDARLIAPLKSSGGGGGGKGGGGSQPSEDANSLRSIATASVLYALCEGEIVGAATGDLRTSIYLNDTVINRPDGTGNFHDFTLDFAPGTQYQGVLGNFTDVQSTYAVGIQITDQSGAIVRSFSDLNADSVVVTLSTPQLTSVDSKGNIHGYHVDFTIELSANGGNYVTVVADSISGKCTTPYQRSYIIGLSGTPPYSLRVTKTSPNPTTSKIQADLYWVQYTTRINTALSYPNTALLGLSVRASEFKDIPKVSILIKGLKILYPANYDPVYRTYTGTWDGTFTYGWTDNPAWIFYDMLSNNRYGCGKRISVSNIDKWSLYKIAQYCDGWVPNGYGSYEPRFLCNVFINSRQKAYDVLNNLASVFRGMIFWGAGTILSVQDAPGTPVRLYTEANVIQQIDDKGHVTKPTFTYAGTSAKARHTVALVDYLDPTDRYKKKTEYVENITGLLRYGYREVKISAFACTSRSQARRVGLWALYTELYETETVQFSVGSEGLLARPGDLILIADPLRAGVRIGGRIITSSGLNTINLDSSVTIAANTTYQLSFTNSTGQFTTVNVLNTPGTYTSISTSGYTAEPVAGAIWTLSSTTLQPQLFRVVSVSEKGDGTYDILAITSNQSKYNFIEDGMPLTPAKITQMPNYLQVPVAPSAITITENLYVSIATVTTRVNIGFQPSTSPGVVRYQVECKAWDDLGDYDVLGNTETTTFIWLNASSGIYSFRVKAVNKLGIESAYTYLQKEILGLNVIPATVTNFIINPLNDQLLLSWDLSSDLAVTVGGNYIIRYSPTIGGTVNWSSSSVIATIPGSTSSTTLPLYNGTYSIKAVGSTGKQSSTAAIATINYKSVLSLNNIAVLQESPTFPGIKTHCFLSGVFLQLSDSTFFDSQSGNFDSRSGNFGAASLSFDNQVGNFDSQAGNFDSIVMFYPVFQSGTYTFANSLDLGAVYTSRVTATFSCKCFNPSALFDFATGSFDSQPGTFEGTDTDGAGAVLQIATSQDGSTYSAWQNMLAGDYSARSFKFQVLLTSTDVSKNVDVLSLSVTIDMPDRVESGIITTSASVVSNITYSYPYKVNPALGVTLENAATGDYYTITSQNQSGFSVSVQNSSGTKVVRNLHWMAKGYGRKTA
jgi:predicted phage tail protein